MNVKFVHIKQNQKMVSKSIRQRNIPTHANAVTELLLTKLNIPIISQNVTAHTVIMPMSPIHRIPPRFPHGSPPRFPPTYPPRFPRSPMY